MKLLENESTLTFDEQVCASRLMEVIPLIMRTLRQEIRRRRPGEFSVPAFRVLAFLRRNEGSTLSDVTDHIGLTRPTMSKTIDGLVRRGWVARETGERDRRCIHLRLTDAGLAVINGALEKTRQKLAEMIRNLSSEDRSIIGRAMEILETVFTAATGSDAAGEGK